MYELNQEIARRCFASLILDYEITQADINESGFYGFIPHVTCRVLIDGYYHSTFTAENRQAAIEKFNNTEWRF